MKFNKEKCLELYKEGHSVTRLSEYYGKSYLWMRKFLKENNIVMRNGGHTNQPPPMFNVSLKGKYDYMFLENINKGRDYKEYLN